MLLLWVVLPLTVLRWVSVDLEQGRKDGVVEHILPLLCKWLLGVVVLCWATWPASGHAAGLEHGRCGGGPLALHGVA